MSQHTRSLPYLKDWSSRNRCLPCSAGGCAKLRHWTTQWCRLRTQRVNLYGHPRGRMIYRREYRGFFKTVRQHVARCPAETLRVMHELLRDILTPHWPPKNFRSRRYVVWQELERLRGVSNREQKALLIVSAIYLLSHHYPDILPDDERLTRALAHGVLRLAPRPRNVRWLPTPTRYRSHPAGASATSAIGSKIRRAFVPWFLHITTTAKNSTSEESSRT